MKHPWPEAIFLALAVLAAAVGCAGLVRMRGAAARVHFSSWLTLAAPPLVAAAILCEEGFSAAGLKALLIMAVLLAQGPLLSHILGRAIHAHDHSPIKPARGGRR